MVDLVRAGRWPTAISTGGRLRPEYARIAKPGISLGRGGSAVGRLGGRKCQKVFADRCDTAEPGTPPRQQPRSRLRARVTRDRRGYPGRRRCGFGQCGHCLADGAGRRALGSAAGRNARAAWSCDCRCRARPPARNGFRHLRCCHRRRDVCCQRRSGRSLGSGRSGPGLRYRRMCSHVCSSHARRTGPKQRTR